MTTPTYTMPTNLGDDTAFNLAMFMLENTGSIFGEWQGRMRAKDQRALYGEFLGRGTIIIDADDETVRHTYTSAYGWCIECNAFRDWAELRA